MDETALAGMIFTLLCLLIVGGFILMYPLSRRLGQLMEQWVQEKKEGGVGTDAAGAREAEALRRELAAARSELAALAERQTFLEGLMESPDRERLPTAGKGLK